MDWAAVGRSVLGALVLYGALQFAGAAMIWREWVAEEKEPWLIAVFAALSVLVAQLLFLRRVKTGRLVLCLLSGAGFAVVLLLLGLTLGEVGSLRSAPVPVAAAAAASAAAALLGGGKKRSARLHKTKNRKR